MTDCTRLAAFERFIGSARIAIPRLRLRFCRQRHRTHARPRRQDLRSRPCMDRLWICRRHREIGTMPAPQRRQARQSGFGSAFRNLLGKRRSGKVGGRNCPVGALGWSSFAGPSRCQDVQSTIRAKAGRRCVRIALSSGLSGRSTRQQPQLKERPGASLDCANFPYRRNIVAGFEIDHPHCIPPIAARHPCHGTETIRCLTSW